MRNIEEYSKVINLYIDGRNKSEISKETNIPRRTISDWINKTPKKFNNIECYNKDKLKSEIINDIELQKVYSYILGLYLGDGYINKTSRTYRLRITMDLKYNKLNSHVINQLKKIFKNNKISKNKKEGCVDISLYNKQLPILFPQHGLGKKHFRDLSLKEWQLNIIDEKELLKGLFHSDGCYYEENINNKLYERYSFSNKSESLNNIFHVICEHLGVEYNFYIKKDGIGQTRINKKESVFLLKEIIGTKNNII